MTVVNPSDLHSVEAVRVAAENLITRGSGDLSEVEAQQIAALKDRAVELRRIEQQRADDLALIRSAAYGTGGPAQVVDVERAGGFGAPSLGGKFRNPWDTSTVRFGQPGSETELRHRAEDAIERMSYVTDEKVRSVCARIVGNDESTRAAQMVLATTSPEYSRAFAKIVRHNGQLAALTADEQAALQRSLAIADGATGGYLVPFQLDPSVILTASGSLNQVRQISRVVQSVVGTWHGVSSAGVTGSWDDEADEVSDDSPDFDQPTITAGKGQVFVEASFEAIQDTSNLAQEIATMMAFEKDRMESVAFVTGNGDGKPKGIVTALAAVDGSVVETNTAATLAVEDIFKLDESLPARWAANASWLGHRAIYNKLRQFDEYGGSALWGHLDEARKRELLGRPNFVAEAMASAVVAGAKVLAFGDFSNYVIVDRIGTTIEYIPNLFGSSGRPTGKRGWLTHFRVGADVVNPNAFRLLEVADQAS